MTKKNIWLTGTAVVLAILCIYVYKDRFLPEPIRIGHRFMERRAPRGRAQNARREILNFLLNKEIQLTSVKVFPLSQLETNGNPLPVWELVSDSNSIPVNSFVYGANVRGMRRPVGARGARPLQPGTAYRLFIEAGRKKAEYDFTVPQDKS